MKFYHITPKINLPSIMQKGIIPMKKQGIGRDRDSVLRNIVFLTDNIPFICETQLTKRWISDHKPIAILVNAPGAIPYKPFEGIISKHEFVIDKVMPENFVDIFEKIIHSNMAKI